MSDLLNAADSPSSFPSLSFTAFHTRASAGADVLCVAFLGGSLTWGAQATDPHKTSYRAIVGRKLEETYPLAHFRFQDAAIGGTGSQLAAFRLQRDVLACKPDLVFLDFTINDNPYVPPDLHKLAAYESLVRRLIQAGIPVVQVILPAKKDVMANPPERPLDARHKEIGHAYSLPVADAVTLALREVAAGNTTPDLLWDLPEDQTHPGDAGYALYAQAAWTAYTYALETDHACSLPEKMLHAETYMTVNRQLLTTLSPLPSGWSHGKPHRNAVAYDFVCSRWMNDLVIARAESEPLRLAVSGTGVLLFGEQTKLSGRYSVQIDGGEAVEYSARCADGNMRLVNVIAQDLTPGREHSIVITPLLIPGEELRLESICVAGAPAMVRIAG